MLTLVLTRHGHTDRSEPEQYLGQRIDIALSARGRSDAARLRDRIAGIRFDRVISSPLRRAHETAGILAPGSTIERDERLAEADYGSWEGTPRDQLDRRWPDLRAAWEDDPATHGAPGGETGEDVARRAAAFLRDLAAWEAAHRVAGVDGDHRVLAVAHSTLNRVLLAVALEVPVRDYRRRFRQDWLNLTALRLAQDGRAQLLLANDIAHLRPAGATPWSD